MPAIEFTIDQMTSDLLTEENRRGIAAKEKIAHISWRGSDWYDEPRPGPEEQIEGLKSGWAN